MALPGSQQRCAWPETPVPGVTTQPVPEDSALGLVGGAPPRMTALLGCRQCSACLPTALAPPAPAAALMPSVSCTVPALCVVLPSGMALTQDPVTLVPKLRHILGSLLPRKHLIPSLVRLLGHSVPTPCDQRQHLHTSPLHVLFELARSTRKDFT